MAERRRRGADGAFRLHQSRHHDFSKGRRLGHDDHVVEWVRPARPDWMDKETYRDAPKTMEIRETRSRVSRPGYRTREVIVATTLLDAERYGKGDLAELYGHRWRVELDIRDVKQTLKMDVLRGKTPQTLRREIWSHLLAYNLARQVMAQAAREKGLSPRGISFAGAKQTMDAFGVALSGGEGEPWRRLVKAMPSAIAGHRVGEREGRREPRQVKRRPKTFPMMTRPRGEARAAALAAAAEGKGGNRARRRSRSSERGAALCAPVESRVPKGAGGHGSGNGCKESRPARRSRPGTSPQHRTPKYNLLSA